MEDEPEYVGGVISNDAELFVLVVALLLSTYKVCVPFTPVSDELKRIVNVMVAGEFDPADVIRPYILILRRPGPP